MNLEITKIIDRYLMNDLNAEEISAVEEKMKTDENFKSEVEKQQLLYKAIDRYALKNVVKSKAKIYHNTRLLKFIAMATIILGVLTASVLYYIDQNNNEHSSDEKLESSDNFELNDADKDFENIPVQLFKSNGKGEILISEQGVLISLAENSFLLHGKNYSGPVRIAFQEALSADDIVKSGLSTMSGDKSLATEGMFALHAYTENGDSLTINPKIGVYVQLPVNEIDPNLKLFKGVRDEKGQVDWQNPVDLEKLPILAKMNDLDFYPTGYEQKLNELKWLKTKKSRDSLYLSFERRIITGYGEIKDLSPNDSIESNGKSLFNMKCAICHKLNGESTGPNLFNVRQKWNMNSKIPGSLYTFVRNWAEAASKDPYANKVINLTSTAMPFYSELSNYDIDQIFNYVDSQSPTNTNYIPPSKVLGFWKKDFNNTLLATKEFEQRMASIHKTCDRELLKLYTSNLNAKLSELDARAVKMGYSEFQSFADQQIGAVSISNPHLKNIADLYERNSNKLNQIAIDNSKANEKRERALDQQIDKSRSEDIKSDSQRKSRNFSDEYKLNMQNACNQLEDQKYCKAMNTLTQGLSVGTTLLNTGSYNLDKFINDVTSSRTTSTFTDPSTGKTATIKYTQVEYTIENSEKYLKLYAYFVPDKLKHFERIDAVNGKINRGLNDEIQYNLVVIGVSENGFEMLENSDALSLDAKTIKLKAISEKEMKVQLKKLNFNDSGNDLHKEMKFWKNEQLSYKTNQRRQKDAELRSAIEGIIFPCFAVESATNRLM